MFPLLYQIVQNGRGMRLLSHNLISCLVSATVYFFLRWIDLRKICWGRMLDAFHFLPRVSLLGCLSIRKEVQRLMICLRFPGVILKTRMRLAGDVLGACSLRNDVITLKVVFHPRPPFCLESKLPSCDSLPRMTTNIMMFESLLPWSPSMSKNKWAKTLIP